MNSLSLTCLSLCVLLVGLWTPTWADPRAEGVPPREEAVTAFSGPPDATAANALLTPKPATAAQGGIGATRDRVIEAYGKLPLHFEANLGQTDPRVKFLSRGPRHTVFLTSTEAVLVLTEPEPRGPGDQQTPKSVLKKREQATRSVLHMTFLGANVAHGRAGGAARQGQLLHRP